jgi:hypothetical protein
MTRAILTHSLAFLFKLTTSPNKQWATKTHHHLVILAAKLTPDKHLQQERIHATSILPTTTLIVRTRSHNYSELLTESTRQQMVINAYMSYSMARDQGVLHRYTTGL